MGKKSKRRNPPSKNKKKKGQKKIGGISAQSAGISNDKNDGVDWTYYDEKLQGNGWGNYSGEGDDDDEEINEEKSLTKKIADISFNDSGEGPPSYPEGSRNALKAALECVWSDQTISNPYGVGRAMGPKDEWMDWAIDTATCPDQLDDFFQEHDKDMEMHKSTLDKLLKEMQVGNRGCTDCVMALNCIFHFTFDRLGLDFPPFLNLEQGMWTTNFNRIKMQIEGGEQESLYKSHMKIWKGYENRAFKLLKAVQEHPLIPKPEPCNYMQNLSPKTLKNRGVFPSAERRKEWESSDEGDDSFSDEGCYGFSGTDVDDLLSQGVKPWDDDAGAVLAALNGY